MPCKDTSDEFWREWQRLLACAPVIAELDAPPLISVFPWLKDLLGCWATIINPAGGRVLTRECCNNYPFTPNRWYVRRK